MTSCFKHFIEVRNDMQDRHISDLSLRYNSIELLDQQRNAVDYGTLYQVLNAAAAIFLKHNANLQFSIALLHRHHDLPHGHAMVNFHDSHMEYICRVAPLGVREIFPTAFHLHDEKFLPYEFSFSPTPTPAPEFLGELAIFLKSRGLHHILALSITPSLDLFWMETLSKDGEGTVTRQMNQQLEESCLEYTITEWGVVQNSGGCEIRALKGCETNEAGIHKRS